MKIKNAQNQTNGEQTAKGRTDVHFIIIVMLPSRHAAADAAVVIAPPILIFFYFALIFQVVHLFVHRFNLILPQAQLIFFVVARFFFRDCRTVSTTPFKNPFGSYLLIHHASKKTLSVRRFVIYQFRKQKQSLNAVQQRVCNFKVTLQIGNCAFFWMKFDIKSFSSALHSIAAVVHCSVQCSATKSQQNDFTPDAF